MFFYGRYVLRDININWTEERNTLTYLRDFDGYRTKLKYT